MKRLIIAAATLLAAGCQPMPAEGGKADLAQAAPAAQTPADEASACAARGGKMLPQGRIQSLQCVVSYSDAGQRCTDGDDCQGDCRVEETDGGFPTAGSAVVGRCQASSSRFGCYTTVENGRAEATICVD